MYITPVPSIDDVALLISMRLCKNRDTIVCMWEDVLSILAGVAQTIEDRYHFHYFNVFSNNYYGLIISLIDYTCRKKLLGIVDHHLPPCIFASRPVPKRLQNTEIVNLTKLFNFSQPLCRILFSSSLPLPCVRPVASPD